MIVKLLSNTIGADCGTACLMHVPWHSRWCAIVSESLSPCLADPAQAARQKTSWQLRSCSTGQAGRSRCPLSWYQPHRR